MIVICDVVSVGGHNVCFLVISVCNICVSIVDILLVYYTVKVVLTALLIMNDPAVFSEIEKKPHLLVIVIFSFKIKFSSRNE